MSQIITCPDCNGEGKTEQTICGLCEDNIPHSSCDDTSSSMMKCGLCEGYGSLKVVPHKTVLLGGTSSSGPSKHLN